MSREVYRVPLDFALPIREKWSGYLMPEELHSTTCASCGGSGYNAMTRVIADAFYDSDGFGYRWTYEYGTAPDGSKAEHPPWKTKGDCRKWCFDLTQDEADMLAAEDLLWDLTHTFKAGEGWKPRDPMPKPTAAEVNHYFSHASMGHHGSTRYHLVKHRATRMGVFGHCAVCNGEGELWRDEAHKQANEDWKRTDPPKGDGWQMWETTSEGSPISPVFATSEELARWLADTGASTFGSDTADYDTWLAMIKEGWAMSMASIEGVGVMSGVDAVASEPRQ